MTDTTNSAAPADTTVAKVARKPREAKPVAPKATAKPVSPIAAKPAKGKAAPAAGKPASTRKAAATEQRNVTRRYAATPFTVSVKKAEETGLKPASDRFLKLAFVIKAKAKVLGDLLGKDYGNGKLLDMGALQGMRKRGHVAF